MCEGSARCHSARVCNADGGTDRGSDTAAALYDIRRSMDRADRTAAAQRYRANMPALKAALVQRMPLAKPIMDDFVCLANVQDVGICPYVPCIKRIAGMVTTSSQESRYNHLTRTLEQRFQRRSLPIMHNDCKPIPDLNGRVARPCRLGTCLCVGEGDRLWRLHQSYIATLKAQRTPCTRNASSSALPILYHAMR